MTTSALSSAELRRLTLREIFRANVGIGEFESLGKSFPDIALHYIHSAFDSFAHFENCPCSLVGACEPCLFDGEDHNKISYAYILSAYIEASLADLLVQRFLVLDYEKQLRGTISLFNVSQKKMQDYLDTNATKEEKSSVATYRDWCSKHDAARAKLKGFLASKECSSSATDLARMLDDVDINEVEKCVNLFREYTSTAREMYYAYQSIVSINQKIESDRKKKHQFITNIEWGLTVVGALVLIGKISGCFG